MGVMDQCDLSGKVVLITGAGHGLGEGFAQAVAEAGAAVAWADIDGPAAQQTTDHLRTCGHRAIAVAVDVAQEASVRDMVGATVAQLGGST